MSLLPFHLKIISQYLNTPFDFLNIILVSKKCQHLLDLFDVNPIAICNTSLFPNILTQQIFSHFDFKHRIKSINNYYLHYPITYSYYLKIQDTCCCYNIKLSKQYVDQSINQMVNLKHLEDIIPKEVTILGDYCFQKKQMTSFVIRNGIKSIGKNCFGYCKQLQQISFPTTLTRINNYCFGSCSALTSLTLPKNLVNLGIGCFGGCNSLKTLHIPSSIQFLPKNTFCFASKLTSVTVQKGVVILGEYCFSNCISLCNISLPNTIRIIDKGCFFNCVSLTTINIPSSVTFYGDNCFGKCSQLVNVIEVPKKAFEKAKKQKKKTNVKEIE
ncbi:Leucine rich repeat containing protein BspA family protein [Entamoeba marina]